MSNLPPPPPHHPHPTATTTTTSTSTSTAAEPRSSEGGIGNQIASKTKGLFGAISGAGEVIRGTINETLDGVGDGIANRQSNSVADRNSINSTTKNTSGHSQVGNDSVAQRGAETFRENLELLKGNHSKATHEGNTVTSTSSTTDTRDSGSHVSTGI